MAMIYALHNFIIGKSYIGFTGKLSKRFREHRCLLRNGKHETKPLQHDWFQYGEDSFIMFELQHIPDDATLEQKRAAELGWIDRMMAQELCYNLHRVSFATTRETWLKGQPIATRTEGNKRSPEANLKRSLALRGRIKSPETCAKISASKRAARLMR